jgi:Mrp family chromosome partitioning ATPase
MSIIERALKKAQLSKAASTAGPTDPGAVQSDSPVTAPPVTAPPTAETPAAPPPVAAARSEHERSPDAVTARDLKKIVEVDFDRLREAGRLPPKHANHQTEEEIRRIKWPLLSALAGRGGSPPARNNVVLVTSAEPSEGKSYTSLNLALSIVRDREMRVILVDGDVALPGLTPTLDLDGAPGLNDALDDPNLDINDVTYRTTVDGLLFVPAGKWHEHSPELIAGSRMPDVIQELGRRVGNGIVIIDSPPLLATNEAQAATRYVGHVLMVVRADRTEQRSVMEALELIDKSTPVSAILNGVEPSMLSKYYGSYYYGPNKKYGYGRYGRGPAA